MARYYVPSSRSSKMVPASEDQWRKYQQDRATKNIESALFPGTLSAMEGQAKAEDDLVLQQAKMGLLDQQMQAGERIAKERANFAATRGAPSGVNKRNTRDYVSRGAFTSIGKLEGANLARQEAMLEGTGKLLENRRKSLFGSMAGFSSLINTPEHLRAKDLAASR